MTVAYSSIGTIGVGSTSVTPGLPASLATGDMVLITVVTKPDTATVATPTGWTLVSDVAGGGGTTGNQIGPTRQVKFMREKTAAWSTMPAITVTSGNSTAAVASRWTKNSTMAWSIAGVTGAYGTAATTTNGSVTHGSNPGITSGDGIEVGYSNMNDAVTWSAQSISATGATFGSVTERTDVLETTTGNDIGGMVFTALVTAGTASAAPVTGGTLSAAGRGTATLTRLREVAPPPGAGTGTGTWTFTGTAVGENFEPAVLPQLIGAADSNVEEESHSYCPVIIDTNGNLYTITESTLGNNNQPRAMKSTDGGMTWVEQDAANRPGTDTGSIGDLESGWITYDAGGFLTFTWQRNYPVWVRFRTSDHPTNPDTWQMNTRNQVGTGEGVPQYMSHTKPTNQTYYWCFFGNGADSAYLSVAGATGVESSQSVLDTGALAPAAVLGNNNVSWVVYKKSSQLHYKTLTSTGTLSGSSTRIDTGGLNAAAIPHAKPVFYMNGSDEVITCLFTNASGHLKAVDIINGSPGSEQTVTTSPLTHDPGASGNAGAVVSADVDGTTVHAFWSDSATGDLMHSQRDHGGAWATPDTFESALATGVYWLYVKTNEYPDSTRVISIRYSDGFDEVTETNDIYYDELVLDSTTGGTATGTWTFTGTAVGARRNVSAWSASDSATTTGGTTQVTATRATTWRVRAAVTSSRATTWRVRSSVTATRSTTWRVRAQATATRATTWRVRAAVTSTRATTWRVRALAIATRATTWDVLTRTTATRATTWNVASTSVQVTATRATTWRVRAWATSTRQTTWDVLSRATSTRATSWDVLTRVTATRGTTWDVLTRVTATRSTTWNVASTSLQVTATRATTWRVRAQATVTRATSWDVRTVVTATRGTTWDVLTIATATRATTWRVRAAVTSSRATTWRVRATVTQTRATTWDVLTVVSSSRATTWRVRAQVTQTRSTTWNVASTMVQVTATRSTTWKVVGRITATRSTTWDVRVVATATRATTWDVLAQRTATRATTWKVRAATTATRSTTWDVLARVTETRGTTWAVLIRVTASRSTTWRVYAYVTAVRVTTWDVLERVQANRSTTWKVAVLPPPLDAGRPVTYPRLTLDPASRYTLNGDGTLSLDRSPYLLEGVP